MCCGFCTTRCSGCHGILSTIPAGPGACCPRGTGRPPTTRCSRPRSSSPSHGWPASARPGHGWGCTPIGCWVRGAGSAAGRLGSDGERDEGSNSEAIVYAGAVGLPNLTVVAVDNQSSTYGWGPGGIEAHFAVSGWSAVRGSGRDHAALASAFRVTAAGAASAGPQLVVATVEGKG